MSRLRICRVSELVKRAVGEIIRRDVNSPTSGLITVTDAEVAANFKNARIYYSVIGNADQVKNAASLLMRHRISIQQQMAHAIILKYTPVLEFVYDTSMEHGERILRILNEIEAAQPAEPVPQLHETPPPPPKK